MTSKLLLKLQRDRELWQRICQLVQGIYRRVDAFEASDLLSDRRRHIIYHMPRSSSIHYCTAIAKAAFNKLASYSKTLNLNQEIISLHTHIRLFIPLIAQLVLSCHSQSFTSDLQRNLTVTSRAAVFWTDCTRRIILQTRRILRVRPTIF